MKGFKDAIDSAPGGPLTHFGEFFIGRPDPKYEEYRAFPDRTGVNNLDFEYYNANRQAFGDFSRSMSDFGQMLVKTSADYTAENQAVTFIDNHDVSRFRYIQPNVKPYHASLAVLLTSRGIPNLYYGTEQYLNPGHGISDAGRLFMQTAAPGFSEKTTAYRPTGKLSALRQSNDALAYGTTDILFSNDDALVYKRQFFDKQVIVAVNRQPDRSVSVPALTAALPAGSYADALDGLLYGRTMTVVDQNAERQIPAFTLAGGEVSVWSHNPPADPGEPLIGDVGSTLGRPGNTVYIYGTGLSDRAAVAFGAEQAEVVSAQDNRIAGAASLRGFRYRHIYRSVLLSRLHHSKPWWVRTYPDVSGLFGLHLVRIPFCNVPFMMSSFSFFILTRAGETQVGLGQTAFLAVRQERRRE